jgi:hypothetical protein
MVATIAAARSERRCMCVMSSNAVRAVRGRAVDRRG